MKKVLVANRGEIALRISRAVQEIGMQAVAVFPADDAQSLHVSGADVALELPGRGAAAYLDIPTVVAAAKDNDCDAVHPGYGFLSENADFAAAVEAAGMVFIGPSVGGIEGLWRQSPSPGDCAAMWGPSISRLWRRVIFSCG